MKSATVHCSITESLKHEFFLQNIENQSRNRVILLLVKMREHVRTKKTHSRVNAHQILLAKIAKTWMESIINMGREYNEC